MARKRSPGNSSRADALRAYWAEVRAYAERRGVSPTQARAAKTFRASYQATGKAPQPKRKPAPTTTARGSSGASGSSKRARPVARSKGTRGLVTGGRSKTVRSYWDFANAYAATKRMPPSEARMTPEFRAAYASYREGLAAESRAKSPEDRTEAKFQQLDALAGMGMISPEEVAAAKRSPKFRKQVLGTQTEEDLYHAD